MGLTRKRAIEAAEVVSPYLSEFIGVFFVTTTFGCNAAGGNELWMPTSTAFAIMVGMCAIATGAGGHLNPAVSIAFGLARKEQWTQVIGHCVAQVLGGLWGGFLATRAGGGEGHILVHAAKGFDWLDAFALEANRFLGFMVFRKERVCSCTGVPILRLKKYTDDYEPVNDVSQIIVVYTTAYCFVALSCMAALRNNPASERNQFAPIAVGFVMLAGGHAAMAISGGFFNPALVLGFGLSGGSSALWCLLYLGFHSISAVLATVLFFMTRPEELLSAGAADAGSDFKRACGVVCPCLVRSRRDAAEEDSSARQLNIYSADYRPSVPVRLLSEFLGTYIVVTTFALGSAMAPHSVPDEKEKGVMRDAFAVTHWATAAGLLSMTYALGNVSGAHFNPAVSVAVALTGRGVCSWPEALCFLVAQAGGAAASAATVALVARHATAEVVVRDLGPVRSRSWQSVAVGETLFTAVVVLIVLCMTTVKSPRYLKAPSTRSFQFALAIAMCLAAGGFALEDVSGGIMNPAVSFGVSASGFLSSGDLGGRHLWCLTYCLWQLLGGAIAAMLFMLTHPLEYERDPLLSAIIH